MDFDYDALFIGSSTKDMIMLVESPPESDQRIQASRFITAPGGVAPTAAAAHQKLGGKTALISIVGEDETGAYIAADLGAQKFAFLQLLRTDRASSSTSMIQVEKNGKRCLTVYGGCIQDMTFDRLDLGALHHTRILHLGVMNPDLMLQLARYCKEETTALLSIDGGNVPKELADQLLPYADYYIPDHKTAWKTLGLGPAEACEYYVAHGAAFAAVTAAEEGTYGYDGRTPIHASALTVSVLDTTGAGDNFHGAFLYALREDWPMEKRLRFANIFASLSCEGLGGRSKAPELDTVMKYMERGEKE